MRGFEESLSVTLRDSNPGMLSYEHVLASGFGLIQDHRERLGCLR